MEEDVGVKVTRLRRRLSVEQSDDGGSPATSAVSTPTKKRGGRLAAKPQLELIDENAQVRSPRKTRRTSLAPEAEEKPVTPSRRSARIKSNSSIVLETLSVPATDSPRAKRAARRNSQAGSDNDAPATPIRQTRRTRKDSTSSVEQVCLPSPQRWPDIIGVSGPQEVTLQLAEEPSSHKESSTLVKPLPVAEMVIVEEPENEVQKAVNKSTPSPSAANADELSPNSARKSKRLLEKRNRRSGSYKTDQDSSTVENKSLNISTSGMGGTTSQSSPSNRSVTSKECNENLSESIMSSLKKIETESKINLSNHNKSASAVDSIGNDKSKRIRTESWPTATISVERNDSIHFSDNELSKKKKENIDKSTSRLSVTCNNQNIDKSNKSINEKNTSLSFLDTSSKRKKRKSETNIEENSKLTENINTLQVLTPKEDNCDVTRDMAKLFENAPEDVQAIVYFDDSDSNSVGATNLKIVEHVDSEDQCVPVVTHDFKENLSPKKLGGNDNIVVLSQENLPNTNASLSKIASDGVNNSCEPMDIDETIHEEILQKSVESLHQSNKSLKLSQHSIIEEKNNSKRKSSVSNSDVKTPDLAKNSKRKTSLSNSDINSPDLSKNNKRKTSISNPVVNTPDLSKDNRKSSISNSGADIPDLSVDGKRKSSNTDSIADTSSNQSKNYKRKSSISSSGTDTPDKSKNYKRKSSISNSTADTPDLSKNNKSTLILSQLKDVSSTSENLNSSKLASNELLSKSDINDKSNLNTKMSKGNLSLNDIKGTPKQNSIQKLAMQTSTPITTQQPGINTKIEEQKQESIKKNKSKFSKSMNDTDSSEEDSYDDEEHSVERNEHLDDEAEEASDDYESGDSQDEEDRKYVKENEIVERGETLTSDDDMSDDTDYEKDSFVVSSDAEDNEMLSGSGDDLSMSDNELSMSKKSKKKFNERKLKEQKNASREMFESRHKLDASSKSPTPKTKKNRMRIDSSLLASDEEVVVKPKKSNRMRLDSTLNESVKREETDQSLNKNNKNKSKQGSALDTSDRQGDTNISQKKDKSMQDSICDKTTTDEKEITIFNESNDYADPLQVLVKQEPKTPQKDLNMSVVQFTDREEIVNVQVTEGNSIMNQTGADPLQSTMAYEDSDSSECEELLQNYDSVLNKLNKDNKTTFNKNNVSLNSGKNTKRNQVEPIIDQLNLTQTKKSKKNMGDESHLRPVKAAKVKQESESEDSSDSIDLHLLFSDNCGSDEEQKLQQNKTDDDNMFIPLKKCPGKTNIPESIGSNASQQDTTLNESSRKNKKRKSSLGATELVDEQEDTLNVSKSVSINESGTNKNKEHSTSEDAEQKSRDTLNISENVDISNESGKKEKKHSMSEPVEEVTLETLNVSKNESGAKKKKKHSISEHADEAIQDSLQFSENVNVSLNESAKKKKKKHSVSEPSAEETQDSSNVSKNVNVSMNESGMKKKKKYSISEPAQEETQVNVSMNESGMKKKKKHSISEPAQEETRDILDVSKNGNVSMNESGSKKKKKHSISEPTVDQTQGFADAIEPELNESTNKKKKKRKTSLPTDPEGDLFFIDTTGNLLYDKDGCGEVEEPPLNVLYERKKKKKGNKLKIDPNENGQNERTIGESNPPITPKSEKKKKKQRLEVLGVRDAVEPELNESTKKKKKRKSSLTAELEDATGCGELEEPTLNVVHESKKKRKRNKLKNDRDENVQNDSEKNIIEESNAPKTPKNEKKKKKQKLEALVHDDDSDGAPDEAPYQSEKASEMDLQNIETVSEPADSGKKKHKKKKKKKASSKQNQSGDSIDTENVIPSNSKKRKRNTSNADNSQESGDAHESVEIGKHNELVGGNKKRKIAHNEDIKTSEATETQVNKNKKRKHRDDDGDSKQTKVKKDSSFQEVHVPRLPHSILRQLDDKPRKIDPPKIISTSNFVVENARQKRSKPSNYLEESIYLDEKSPLSKKQRQRIKKPKVLPFIPTASISDSGFTTNFKINKLSHTTTFEAGSVTFSKETYLQTNSIKRLGTYDRYKKQMHHKMSKF